MPTGIYKRTEKHKQKISESHADFSGKNNPFYGREHTKETKLKSSKANLGKVLSEETKKKISRTMLEKLQRGEESPYWKGNSASYFTKHWWIKKQKGSAGKYKCEICGKQARDWSNVDHKYTRNLNDYSPLCRSCHFKNDKDSGLWGK